MSGILLRCAIPKPNCPAMASKTSVAAPAEKKAPAKPAKVRNAPVSIPLVLTRRQAEDVEGKRQSQVLYKHQLDALVVYLLTCFF
jgi:SRSO17 transposase